MQKHNATANCWLPIKKGGLAQLARASALHAEGHRFDSDILHFFKFDNSAISQLVNDLEVKWKVMIKELPNCLIDKLANSKDARLKASKVVQLHLHHI